MTRSEVTLLALAKLHLYVFSADGVLCHSSNSKVFEVCSGGCL
jgi:hypothetical protein